MKALRFDRRHWIDEHEAILNHVQFVDKFDNPVPTPTDYNDDVWEQLENLGYDPNGSGDVRLTYYLGECEYEINTRINHTELPELVTKWLYTGPKNAELVIFAHEFTAHIDLPCSNNGDVRIH